MTFAELIRAGGYTLYVLVFCSIISFAIILERFLYFSRRSSSSRMEFMRRLRSLLDKGQMQQALEECRQSKAAFAAVAYSGLNLLGRTEKDIAHAMERETLLETSRLEKFTNIVGTIGSTAVYIGLFGTILGIMRAFRDIAASGAGGITVVINGISEALVCTAAGLLVAVPAVIAYNYFVKKIDTIVLDMELCASEILDLTTARQK